MKQFFMCLMLGMAMIMSSCSNMDLIESDPLQRSLETNQLKTRSSLDSILYFDSFDTFRLAVEEIASFDSEEEKSTWVKTKYPQFISIFDIYAEAMEEMAEMEDITYEKYNEFQAKYNCLYFPRYLEDAGYYIPMSDLDASYLVNKNCEVSIAGEIINMRDIYEYEKLVELGRAYYSNESVMPIVEIIDCKFDNVDLNSIGPEYDSGWSSHEITVVEKNNKEKKVWRKVKLKARRKFKPNDASQFGFACISLIHLEFCYRRSSPLGWANFSSSTTLEFKYKPASLDWSPTGIYPKSGMSSHDHEIYYPILYATDKKYIYYIYEEASCNASVKFSDSESVFSYNWTMPCLRDAEPYSPKPSKDIQPRYGYYL